jgi:hypothetical protein
MRSAYLFLWAMALAAGGLLLPAARAQDRPAEIPLTFHYRDARGTGNLSVLDVGPAEGTSGRQIKVTLIQNGARFDGSGLTLQIEKGPPYTTLITFSLVRRRGVSETYQGEMISGITVSGQGTYHRTGSPERRQEWGIVLGGAAATGIRGVALAGPISPVERPGVPNTAPLPDALITVQPERGGPEIARGRTDRDGRFEIALPPGTYLLVPLPPQPGTRLPRGEQQTVVVPAGRFAEVVVRYDTGIR